jgi:uncharacterized membrane protein
MRVCGTAGMHAVECAIRASAANTTICMPTRYQYLTYIRILVAILAINVVYYSDIPYDESLIWY